MCIFFFFNGEGMGRKGEGGPNKFPFLNIELIYPIKTVTLPRMEVLIYRPATMPQILLLGQALQLFSLEKHPLECFNSSIFLCTCYAIINRPPSLFLSLSLSLSLSFSLPLYIYIYYIYYICSLSNSLRLYPSLSICYSSNVNIFSPLFCSLV